jgi:hypothetical protein
MPTFASHTTQQYAKATLVASRGRHSADDAFIVRNSLSDFLGKSSLLAVIAQQMINKVRTYTLAPRLTFS